MVQKPPKNETLTELQSIDKWMMINTIFTVLTGIATIATSILTIIAFIER